jgi:hypothetical protein
MPQAVSILFGALFTVVSCLGLGRLILRLLGLRFALGEECVFGFLTGAAGLSWLVFMTCATGVAYRGFFLGLGLVAIAGGIWAGRPSVVAPLQENRGWNLLFFAVFGVYFLLYFSNAMAPEASPDGTSYHLALVGRYLREHGFSRITTSIYANLSQGAEMLFLFAFACGRHSAAALVHLAFLVVLPFEMLLYGRRFGFGPAGACGAALLFTTSVVGLDGTSAYNDVAVAAVLFRLFYLLEIWAVEQNRALLVPIGILSGVAFALKYTAGLGLAFALGYLVWKTHKHFKWMPVLVVTGWALVFILPWVVKNWIFTGNPLAPFFNTLFPNPYVHPSFEKSYLWIQRHQDLKSYRELPLALTVRGNLGGRLGPLYLLSPLALLALLKPAGRRLLLAGFIFALPYAANIGTRFLIPALPFVCLGMGITLQNVPALAVTLVIAQALLSWPGFIQKRLLPQSPWEFRRVLLKEALRIRPEKTYLEETVPQFKQAEMIEHLVPAGAKVFSISNTAESYTSHEILVSFQAAFNEGIGDVLESAMFPSEAPLKIYSFEFPSERFRGLRVSQTATGSDDDMWSIAEFRVYQTNQELPRLPQWRLRAEPNPWDVQLAFDNSPVSRWRSWQAPRPGMYIEVDFGEARSVDQVKLECPVGMEHVRMQLEGDDGTGRWTVASAEPHVQIEQPVRGMRRAAIELLKKRGIHYMLVQPGDEGADDFRANADLWGITRIGEVNETRLYGFD